MFTKISYKVPLNALTVSETCSRLARLESSTHDRQAFRIGSLLTEIEVRSLREEMIRDGGRMKKWLVGLQLDR